MWERGNGGVGTEWQVMGIGKDTFQGTKDNGVGVWTRRMDKHWCCGSYELVA